MTCFIAGYCGWKGTTVHIMKDQGNHRRLRGMALIVSMGLLSMLLFGCSSSNLPKEGIQESTTTSSDAKTSTVTPASTSNGTATSTTTTTKATTRTTVMPTKTTMNSTNTTTTASVVPTSTNQQTTVTQTTTKTTTTTTKPTQPPVSDDIRVICGSFIQPWLVVNWSQERWDQECAMMAQAGMKYVILQSIVDLSYDSANSPSEQDPDSYTLDSVLSLYPSNIGVIKGANNGNDSLKACLKACKKTGMQAIIGPLSDNRWWKYGWGIPKMPSGSTNRATDSYFAKWTRQNADLSNRIANEVMNAYGNEYGEQLYSWYYNNEIWNIDAACAGTDDGVYAKILSNSMNLSLRYYTQITPTMPMMLSSFINPNLSNEEQCGQMWKDIFALTDFRAGDIFAPQDSYGNNNDLDLDKWCSEYKKAVDTEPGLLFWSNNENFRGNGGVARLDDFINKQVNVTAKYASANICFSWNHYYSPDQQNAGYNAAYLDYVRNGKLDATKPSKPVLTVSGTKVILESSDNIGICGIRIYKSSTTRLYKTIVCRRDNVEWLFKTFWLETPGTYAISTYDFCGNESELTSVTIS